jgi:hypothetical protein
MLTDEEKFRFDLEGYLVIPGVLSVEECAALSAQCDEHWPRQEADGTFRRIPILHTMGQTAISMECRN